MTDYTKRPELSEFAMCAMMIMALLVAMGFTALEIPTGLVLIAGGLMSAVKVGRWALSRSGNGGGPHAIA